MMSGNPAVGARVMWGVGQVMLNRVKRLKERLGSAKAALEQELDAHAEPTALMDLITLEDATACALPSS